MRDHAVFDVLDQRGVHIRKAGWRKAKVAKTHPREGVHYHVDDVVPVAKMVVKRNRHAVAETGKLHGFFEALDDFILPCHAVFQRGNIFIIQALVFAGHIGRLAQMRQRRIKILIACHSSSSSNTARDA
ncbi:hypothetical protein SDC9_91750 [bioreactor metagenome]|uniref:Uncharacterized protein n=1 Tax=bioreactor metagenome TaxID=1076179 RepID=A0A644ZVV0_9ZZZZ